VEYPPEEETVCNNLNGCIERMAVRYDSWLTLSLNHFLIYLVAIDIMFKLTWSRFCSAVGVSKQGTDASGLCQAKLC
jgi:hypothetical protein